MNIIEKKEAVSETEVVEAKFLYFKQGAADRRKPRPELTEDAAFRMMTRMICAGQIFTADEIRSIRDAAAERLGITLVS
jgi:hypothetical protein